MTKGIIILLKYNQSLPFFSTEINEYHLNTKALHKIISILGIIGMGNISSFKGEKHTLQGVH